MDTVEKLKQYNIDVHVEFCNSDSLVSRARNNLIAKAMSNPKTTHIMFIDADITWNPEDIIKLLISNKDLCGGVYPLKKYNWERLMKSPSGERDTEVLSKWMEKKDQSIFKNMISDNDFLQHKMLTYNLNYVNKKIEIKDNMTEVRHIATGFMMMKRQVIEKMMEGFPYTKYIDDIGFLKGDENNFAYALFDCGVENNHYLSEDWMFCERWRKLGGSIHVDVTINLIHTGTEHYNGCYLSSIMT
jgi:glycosyltransferase involved in cell wall biosynthesis